MQITIERPGVKNYPQDGMFLTITFLPYGLPPILLHILNEHDEYFQMVYSLLGNSTIPILHIRRYFSFFYFMTSIQVNSLTVNVKNGSALYIFGTKDVEESCLNSL